MRNAAVVLSLAFASSAFAGGGPRYTQAYGQTYAEVGNPGNADYTYELFPGGPTRSIGGVNHRYRIATTEVTEVQWAEFANAITPFLNDKEYYNADFAPTLSIVGFSNGRPVFGADGPSPTRMGWRWAARYCNWLHNDKAVTAEAFESGAYDTSTFGVDPDTTGFPEFTDQSSRSDGARFWIPSEDEWVKAAYYDPNRYGEDQGGYWRHPGMSDDALVSAPPDMGGETNASGQYYEGPGEIPFNVGSYPTAASYYGVLDASGGEVEWTETWINPDSPVFRVALGSRYFTWPGDAPDRDRIDGRFSTFSPDGTVSGLRLAMAVPSPGSSLVVFGFVFASCQRKRS